MNKLVIILLSLVHLLQASAQETMYVPAGATIAFGDNAPAGIFGYLKNNGNISIKQNGQVYFLGKIWMNDDQGKITDGGAQKNSGTGGTVTFYQPYTLFGQQILEARYNDSTLSGPTFANMVIDNSAGVILTSHASAINSVQYKRGHIYLNNYNFILGDNTYTGRVYGYDETRFFVTGTNTSGGFLKYYNLPQGTMVVYPVGPTTKAYSPLQLINRGTADAFFARAFEKVYSNATTGSLVTDSTLQVTWNIGKLSSASIEALVTLQHDMPEEDPTFTANRNSSYVSLYNDANWDKPFAYITPQTPGIISSSFSISSAMMNSRRLTMGQIPLYLTKKVSKVKKSMVIPNVFSPNGDNINDRWVIKGLADYDKCRVDIYNRYGQMIFQSTGYNKPWDGTYKNSPMPVGTYYYLINLEPGDQPLSGSVTILR